MNNWTLAWSDDGQSDWQKQYDLGYQAYENNEFWLALSFWLPLAQQGVLNAQMAVGGLYHGGHDMIPTDYTKSRHWFIKAAERGAAEAQYMLGEMYMYGHGVPQDNIEADKWLRRSAEQEYPEAQFYLAILYWGQDQKGWNGANPNYDEAFRWISKCSVRGNLEAQLILGTMYALGQLGEINYVQSLKWFYIARSNSGSNNQTDLISVNAAVEELVAEMTAAEIADAISLAENWICDHSSFNEFH